MKFRWTLSRTIVENPVASVQTGTRSAFIEGLHPSLFVGVGLLYLPATGHRPAAFTGNTFALLAWNENQDGQRAQLSSTPINGATGQDAPDAWDGSTTLPMLELVHTYAGLGAGDVGRWDVVVTVAPALEMCEADFVALAQRVAIRVDKVTLA